jgi:hypothetical protein
VDDALDAELVRAAGAEPVEHQPFLHDDDGPGTDPRMSSCRYSSSFAM